MKIKKLHIRRLVSGPGFSNRAVEAEVEIADYQSAESALRDADDWIADQLGTPNKARGFTLEEAEMLADQLRDMRAYAHDIDKRWSKILTALIGRHAFRPLPSSIGATCRLCNQGESFGDHDATLAPVELRAATPADEDVPF